MKNIYRNALICENITKLKPEEKQKAIQELLKTKGLRELSRELGIPHTTLYDWKENKKEYKEKKSEISLKNILIKIQHINIKTFKDWGRLEQIKEEIEKLIKKRGEENNSSTGL